MDSNTLHGPASVAIVAAAIVLGLWSTLFPQDQELGIATVMALAGLVSTYYFGVQTTRRNLGFTDSEYRDIVMAELIFGTVLFAILLGPLPTARIPLTYFSTLTVASLGVWLGVHRQYLHGDW